MRKLAYGAGPAGWALIAVGFFVLVGGSAAWAADYLYAEVGTAANWLTLGAALGFGMALSFTGVSLLALAADSRRALKRISDPVGYPS